MTSTSRRKPSGPRLSLSVRHLDGQVEDVYVRRLLSIGTDHDNEIVLSDEDDAVRRIHAKVYVNGDGVFELACVDDATLQVGDGTPVQTLALLSGTRFRIGRSEFECSSDEVTAEPLPAAGSARCPFCGTTKLPRHFEIPTECPACKNRIMVLGLVVDRRPELVAIPTKYGIYRAQRYIAHGGMGLLIQSVHKQTRELAAVKVLLPNVSADESRKRRFDEEYRSLARISHRNVLRPIEHGEVAGFPYIVTEWLGGKTLGDVVNDVRHSKKELRFELIRRWFLDCCDGLVAIHSAGLVHRDIKPANILLTDTGRAVVADLGIAKLLEEGEGLTTTALAPGTFDYMAPEQLRSSSVDARADQYSLGVTFYEIATGRTPKGSWTSASNVNRDIPPYFDLLLERLLQPNREDRFASMDALRRTLAEATVRRRLQISLGREVPTQQPGLPPQRLLRRFGDWLTNCGLSVCQSASDATIPLVRAHKEDRNRDVFHFGLFLLAGVIVSYAYGGIWGFLLVLAIAVPMLLRAGLRYRFGRSLLALQYLRAADATVDEKVFRTLSTAAIRCSPDFALGWVARSMCRLVSGRTQFADQDIDTLFHAGAYNEAVVLHAIRHALEGDDITAEAWLAVSPVGQSAITPNELTAEVIRILHSQSHATESPRQLTTFVRTKENHTGGENVAVEARNAAVLGERREALTLCLRLLLNRGIYRFAWVDCSRWHEIASTGRSNTSRNKSASAHSRARERLESMPLQAVVHSKHQYILLRAMEAVSHLPVVTRYAWDRLASMADAAQQPSSGSPAHATPVEKKGDSRWWILVVGGAILFNSIKNSDKSKPSSSFDHNPLNAPSSNTLDRRPNTTPTGTPSVSQNR